MNYITNEVQDNQQRGVLSAMFGDSRKRGLDNVRVYSSVLHNAGVFGETSAEVTGVFKTANAPGKTDVDKTSKPTILIDDGSDDGINLNTYIPVKVAGVDDSTTNTYSLDLRSLNLANGSEIVASASGTKLYINNDSDGSYIYNGQTFVRVVAQQGYKAPYILVLRFK
jgi:hypothetical protein